MSAALVKEFEADFEPEKFSDDYQEQLRELIDAKLEKGDAFSTEETFGERGEAEEGGEVLDLMEALRRSVEQSRGDGKAVAEDDEAAAEAEDDKKEAPKKKAAPRKKKAG